MQPEADPTSLICCSAAIPTILIVDDSSSMRSYVCQLLVGAGYQVLQAENGCACMATLQNALPDVVLLDIEMPEMSGLEVLRGVQLTPRLFSIILFTTQSSLEQIAAGLDLGADDYIVKPFKDLDLLARIRAAVRNSRHKRDLNKARQETEAALDLLLKAQQKLVEQEKVGAVARLAAGVAHHINNPLGFVMSNLSTMDRYAQALLLHADDLASRLRRLDPETEQQIDQSERAHRIRQIRNDLPYLLQETRDGGQRIALIVQQLAQLERGLGNQGALELELDALIHPLVGMLAALAPPGTKVNWTRPECGITIHGSLTLLNAALVALLKNACEALESSPGTISVALLSQPDFAEITIADSGAGVADQDLPFLFDPFFTTKTPDSHVGLGLTIAQRFIASHGGQISVSSDATGTCVKVRIPTASVSQH